MATASSPDGATPQFFPPRVLDIRSLVWIMIGCEVCVVRTAIRHHKWWWNSTCCGPFCRNGLKRVAAQESLR